MVLRYRERIRRSHLFWHLVFFSLILLVIYVVLKGLGQILTPVASALVISYLLDPVVSWMERRFQWPRWLGSLILFILALVFISAFIVVVLPIIVREIHEFGQVVKGYLDKILNILIPWLENSFKIKIPNSIQELINQFGDDIEAFASKALAPLGGMAGKVAQRVAGFFSSLGTLLLIPIFTFYFLPKFPAILKGAEELIPRRYLGWVQETAREVDCVLASWIRGQLTVIAILAVLYSVGLTIAGVKMAVLIGALTGLMAFIPYVGVVIGLSMTILVCLLEYSGLSQFLWVGVVFALVQAADGLFLTPQIVGEKTGLGPVGVLLALMLGGSLFGFVGVLLAVPTAAALVVVLKRGLVSYKSSLFYQKGQLGPDDTLPR